MSCNKPESSTSGQVIIQADPCKDSTFARMDAYVNNFFDTISNFQNDVDGFQNEMRETVDLVGDTITGFVNKSLGSLTDKLTELIPKAITALERFLISLNTPIPIIKLIETPLPALVKGLFDGLFCGASKVINAAKDAIEDLLTAAVKNVVNGVSCVADQIVGGFFNDLVNITDSITGPLLGPIQSILGAFFKFNPKSFLTTGIDVLKKVEGLFSCGDEKICPTTSKYKVDVGPLKDLAESEIGKKFKGITSGTAVSQGAKNLATDFEKKYGKWEVFGAPLEEASTLGPCDFGNVTKCGLPTMKFFGGDGFGGAGNVVLGGIVDNLDLTDTVGDVAKVGKIVGVDITNPGQGYRSAPVVTFEDSCNKGYGAYGRAIIDKKPKSPTYGQIIAVAIISEGENYPADIEELPLYVEKIVIEDAGEDYFDGEIEGVDLTIRDGRIIDAVPQPGFAYNGLPDLNIDSTTGFGAILRPIMNIVPPQTEIIQVIDCIS